MKKKVERKIAPIYIALDTDVLRMLSCFHFSVCNEGLDVNYLTALDQTRTYPLYKLILDGKIKPVVTRTVLKECPKTDKYINFLNEFCLMPDISDEEYDGYRQSVFELAQKYCGKEQLDYFTLFGYVNDENVFVPGSDAINMAEASLAGLNLITNNSKHFVYVEKEILKAKKKEEKGKIKGDVYNKEKYWRRAHGVRSINALEGILFVQNQRVIPSPYPLYFIKEMIKERRLEDLRASDNTKLKSCKECLELQDEQS